MDGFVGLCHAEDTIVVNRQTLRNTLYSVCLLITRADCISIQLRIEVRIRLPCTVYRNVFGPFRSAGQ